MAIESSTSDPETSPQSGRAPLPWILVAEEDALTREMIRQTLTRHGYQVLVAADGIEALDLFLQQSAKIKIILTDIALKGMDGPSLAGAAFKINPQVRVIGTSSWGKTALQAGKLIALQSLGISQLLTKPFGAEELLNSVRKELNRSRLPSPDVSPSGR